jgi:exopolysaccharide production protein ExoZ
MAKLQTLQVARGVAANLVVLAHLHDLEAKYTAGGLLPPATVYGVAGVDLFFVLSGFIMVAVAGRNTGPLQFLWRRAAKIYPTYWLVSLAMLTATIIAPAIYQSSSAPVSLWRSFLLVPGPTLPLLALAGRSFTNYIFVWSSLYFSPYAFRLPSASSAGAWLFWQSGSARLIRSLPRRSCNWSQVH